MNLSDLFSLALIEGVADVLPIDATAHSFLFSRIVGWRAGTIGIAIHFGAALALLGYLWRDVGLIGRGLVKLPRGRIEAGSRLLAKALLTGGPWVAAIAAFGAPPVAGPSNFLTLGIVTLIAALAMIAADRLCMTVNRVEHMNPLTALLIGAVQLLGLLPGVGRVAIALTAARLLGFERPAAFRFVLLSNVPVLIAAGVEGLCRYHLELQLPATTDLYAAGITFILVLAALGLALPWIARAGLLPFAVYRLLFGAVLVGFGFL